MKKIVSIFMSVCMVAAMCVPALAADVTTEGGAGSVPVELTAEATRFSVTVPTVLAISVDDEGVVTTATDAKVINNSYGAVKISDVAVAGQNEWSTVDYNTDMSTIRVNTKNIAIDINGAKTTGADAIDFASGVFNIMDGVGTLTPDTNQAPITYTAKVPAQAGELTGVNVANVIFTVIWNLAE